MGMPLFPAQPFTGGYPAASRFDLGAALPQVRVATAVPNPWPPAATLSSGRPAPPSQDGTAVPSVVRTPGTAVTAEASISAGAGVSPHEKYRAQQSELQSMGFDDRDANISALIAVGGNINAAVERLLG